MNGSTPSMRRPVTKSADGRVATGAAWLKGRNSQRGREEQKHAYRKKKRKNRKTHLTHTGLLMEGVGLTSGWIRPGPKSS
jgi:hypothetical protein